MTPRTRRTRDDDDDGALFGIGVHRLTPGRVRKGLDQDARAARDAGESLPAGLLAATRSLADQLDALERSLRSPGVKPWDRVPMKQIADAYREAYRATFPQLGSGADDPIGRALADFLAGTAADSDPEHPGRGH